MADRSDVPETDALVVGAGFAGLVAATRLADAGCSVRLLEARERVGGRTKPGELAGETIDLGGMWLGPTQRRLAALAKDCGVETHPTPLEGKAVVEVGGALHYGDRENATAALSGAELADFAGLVERVEALCARIDPGRPWEAEGAAELDRTTVGAWLAEHARTDGVRAVFRILVGAVFCAEPQEMSLLWMGAYLKAGGGLGVLISADEGGAQNLLFRGGVHQLALRLAEGLGERLRLEEPVHAVETGEAGVLVRSERGAHRARRAILALPTPLYARIAFDPPLPAEAAALHARTAMGSVIKCWLAYERPFWRERGLNGFALSDRAPFSPFFDATPPGATRGLLAGFFDADHALAWADRSPEERRECVCEVVARMLGEEARTPLDYAETDWTRERFSGGCYGAYAPPGTLTRFGRALRAPVGPLHFAGTETATEWTGYIEGALQSGERAADELLAALRG